MYVLKHVVERSDAKVFIIRPQAKMDEILDRAQPGDVIYTLPDSMLQKGAKRILRAIETADSVVVQ